MRRKAVFPVKKWIRRLCALILCGVLTLPAVPKAQGAAVYFMAVNDTLLCTRVSCC